MIEAPAKAPVKAPVKERVTPLKASEALRLGMLRRPHQAFHSYVRGDAMACALGTIAAAYGKDQTNEVAAQFMAYKFRRRVDRRYSCPSQRCPGSNRLRDLVIHLNDDHRWKRERIADWLEGLGL